MKINTNENINWGLNEEMNAILNGIDLSCEKRVLMTAGEKQFIYDDGQIYSTSSRSHTRGKLLSKEQFREQTEEIKINYMCNKKDDIVIE